jgi:hypothetical protein
MLVIVLFLILRPGNPPEVRLDPEAPQRLEAKLMRLGRQAGTESARTLRLDEAELNAWMRSTLDVALKRDPALEKRQPSLAGLDDRTPSDLSVEDVQSKVLDVRTHLAGDQVAAYVLFDLFGKEISLELQGRLGVRDGYLRLDPTSLWIGSLPVPESTVKGAVDRLFGDPAHRETFRVPPGIRDIRVQDGQLVIDRE